MVLLGSGGQCCAEPLRAPVNSLLAAASGAAALCSLALDLLAACLAFKMVASEQSCNRPLASPRFEVFQPHPCASASCLVVCCGVEALECNA